MMTVRDAGLLGAKKRHSLPLQQRKLIAKKSAATRLKNDPNAFVNMGKKGAISRHAISEEKETEIAKKSVSTRLGKNPRSFKDMGRLGGLATRKNKICKQ